MAIDNDTVKQLLEKLETDRTAYLATQNKLQEALVQILQGQNSPQNAVNQAGFHTPQFGRTLSAESDADANFRKPNSITSRRTGSFGLEGVTRRLTSLYSAEDSSDSEDGESYYANEPLPEEEFNEEQLRDHIRSHQWNQHEKLIFGPIIRSDKLYSPASLFAEEEHTADAEHTTADVYEVSEDGSPLQRSRSDVAHGHGGDYAAWDTLRATNNTTERKQAVGRIIVLREPSALLYGALHLTMNTHFDMSSIYRMLISDQQRTKAYVAGSSLEDPRHQRSLVFCFKYHTLVGENREPLEWQNHDDDIAESAKDGHIPISTCSSVVALSLAGPPARKFRRNSRRTRKPEVSHVYDPFAPWHVITIQNFPDWNSEVDLHETSHHYVNGPDAFLVTLLHEYRDAAKRFRLLARAVGQHTMPSARTMFDETTRDELIFESGDFIYTRRYFWASQTLGTLSAEIEAFVTVYKDTFTEDVWAGTNRTLFPGPASTSARFANWRKKMNHTRKQFDVVITDLENVQGFIAKQQKEIKSLREWLFSGTSVQESRQAVKQALITVEQGYNVKLLTLVTIFFLPLMFVTGVFGMTNMPPEDDFIPAIVMALGVCLPTYLLIAVINKPEAFQKGVAWLLWPWVLCYDWTKRGNEITIDYAKLYKDKYLSRKKLRQGEKAGMKGGVGWMGFQSGGSGRGWGRGANGNAGGRSATFASLDARLEQESKFHTTARRASRPFAFAQPADVRVDIVPTKGRPSSRGAGVSAAPSGAKTRDFAAEPTTPVKPSMRQKSETRSSTIRFAPSIFDTKPKNLQPHEVSVDPSPNASVGQLAVHTAPAGAAGRTSGASTPVVGGIGDNGGGSTPVPEIHTVSPTTPARTSPPRLGFLRRLSSRIGVASSNTGATIDDEKGQV